MKKKIRIIIDISMTVMMPLLMAYSLIGELFHEIAGTHMLPVITAKKVNALKRGFLYVTIGALSVYGVVAFVKRGFPGYMFGKVMHSSKPPWNDREQPHGCFVFRKRALVRSRRFLPKRKKGVIALR